MYNKGHHLLAALNKIPLGIDPVSVSAIKPAGTGFSIVW